MNFKHLVSRQTIKNLSKLNGVSFNFQRNFATINAPFLPSTSSPKSGDLNLNPKTPVSILSFRKYIHSAQETKQVASSIEPKTDSGEEEDGDMNEFLSRFVWIMRRKIFEAYPDSDKQTVDGMLLMIVGKVVSEMEKGGLERIIESAATTPSQDFSEDLWRTVWDVSHSVLEDMEKVRKKEKMKGFLQSDKVKEMSRFAGEIGVRGDLLRQLRFKWAREEMEENEFYDTLKRLRKEAKAREKGEASEGNVAEGGTGVEEKHKVVTLPKRHGKINYKIYGLDLSDPKWTEVTDKIHETGGMFWPEETKPITGKCKLVTDKILSLKVDEDPSFLMAEWKELLQPSRIDWINLLDKLKEQNTQSYFKVAEFLLDEESFQTNIRDYSKLIDAHAKENRLEDAERILKKMNENGIAPDIVTSTVLVHMYSKAGNLDRAREAFESLKTHGFQPDKKVYNSMIMAYVSAGQPKLGMALVDMMMSSGIERSEEVYLTLLRSFAQCGDVRGAGQITNIMRLEEFQPTLESCTLLVEAYSQAGDPDQARSKFDYMIKLGHKPDDRCTASMIAAYGKKNLLDKALNLLLELENGGFEPGPATYTVLVDWLGRLQLINEAEQILGKISELGEVPPFKIHVSLCDMYARAGNEKKALQALGVLEAKKEQVGPDEFERVINGLIAGGFLQDAQRVYALMEAQGFAASEKLKVALKASQTFKTRRPSMR